MDVVAEVTVIKKTYEAILGAAESKARVYSYSSLPDFEELWSPNLVDHMLNEAKQELITIVVIWDGMPPAKAFGIASLAELVTPIDWAVGFSIAVAKKALGPDASADSMPNLRIVIIDLLSHAYTHAPGIKLINQFPKRQLLSMPWVHVAMPFGPTSISSSPVESLSRLGIIEDSVDKNNYSFPTMSSFASEGLLKESIESLSRLWCGLSIAAPDLVDHHAVSNVMAPLVILGDKGESGCPHQIAVLQLYKWIGLINGKISDKASSFWNRAEIKKDFKHVRNFLGKNYKARLLLIDDAALKHRWAEVLQHLLGDFEPYCELACTDAVETILNSLPSESCNSQGDFKFAVSADKAKPATEVDILFLDLRLFPANSDSEHTFFSNVLKAAQLALGPAADRFLRGPLTKEDLNRVESYVKNGASNAGGYDDAITLLPRLIASLDPSLPICIFSSTGRGDALRILSTYPNIFCRWSKPRLQNYAFDLLISETMQRFQDELERAFAWLPGRALTRCRFLADEEDVSGVSTPITNTERLLIKIFFDETGRPENSNANKHALAVGGLLFMSREEDGNYVDDFLRKREFVKQGSDLESLKKDRRKHAKKFTKELFTIAESNGIQLVPFTYSGSIIGTDSPKRSPVEDYLSNIGVGDNLWRTLVASALEQLIFVYGKKFAGNSPISLEVHIATRRRGFRELAEACSELDASSVKSREATLRDLLVDTLGLEVVPCKNGLGVEFVSRETPRSILENVRAPYWTDDFRPMLSLVRGFNISNPKSDARPTHFYADALLEMLIEKDDCVKRLPYGTIEENFNSRLVTLLNAQRQLATGKCVHALMPLIQHEGRLNAPSPNAKCSRIVMLWLRNRLQELNPSDFYSLASMQRITSPKTDVEWKVSRVNNNKKIFVEVGGSKHEFDLPRYASDLQPGDEFEYFLARSFDDRVVIDTKKGRK